VKAANRAGTACDFGDVASALSSGVSLTTAIATYVSRDEDSTQHGNGLSFDSNALVSILTRHWSKGLTVLALWILILLSFRCVFRNLSVEIYQIYC
jgi:hypothetical protein